jgi:hypothetical protein
MLRAIDNNLWQATGDLWMPGGMHFPIRMTVIRLETGGLVLHSPIPIGEPLARELAALGPVEHLIAPNKLHHLYLGAAMERYPEARVFVAPGLAQKRADLPLTPDMRQVPEVWSGQLEPILLRGVPWINEVVFFHPPSQTLVVTDLFFHITQSQGWVAPVVLRLVGAWRKPAQSLLWRLSCKDKDALAQDMARVFALPLARVIPAHGDILEGDASARLRRALPWISSLQARLPQA